MTVTTHVVGKFARKLLTSVTFFHFDTRHLLLSDQAEPNATYVTVPSFFMENCGST